VPRCCLVGWDVARGKCLGLHLQVDLSIDVGRAQTDMAKPRTNRVNTTPAQSK
jgi:hypothetical protein